jgi:hypothetical protein
LTETTTPIKIQSSYIDRDTLHFCTFPNGSAQEGWGYEWLCTFLVEHLDGDTDEARSFYGFLKAQLTRGEEAIATISPDRGVVDIEIRRHGFGIERFSNLFICFESMIVDRKHDDETVPV